MTPAKTNQPAPGNLPAPLSSFIGRVREIAEIQNLLSTHRLLTLTGSGGSGKTRLALHAAGNLPAGYKDGIWLTELAGLMDGELVAQAVASVLNLQEQAGNSVHESLVSSLQTRQMLLILDNCEHLLDAVAELSKTILESCPHIKILATSREILGVPGEAVFVVPPLSLPDAQPWRGPGHEQETLAAYHQSEAIQLFTARASLISQEFALTTQNGPWVADICRRLDGIPLAIELAAARLRTFSIRQIAERLDDRFHLLTSSLRTVPLRHQTLEAALDWSYQLLAREEKKVLQRLSVFASGWTLDAAETICSDGSLHRTEVMDIVSNVVDKSFIVTNRSENGIRHRFLETIRQYAQEKLEEAGEIDRLRDRHLDYFLHWAETGAGYLTSPQQSEWLKYFHAEHDNFRSALEWSRTHSSRAGHGLRLAAACGRYWKLYGYFSEGRQHLTSLLRIEENQGRTYNRAWGLLWTAHLAYMQSDYSAVRSYAQEGLSICLELGDEGRLGAARALDLLGEVATEVGEYESANELFEEALQIYRALNEKRGIADLLMQLGWAAMRTGDYERANILSNECLPLFRELNESEMLAQVQAGLGELALRQGQMETAKDFLNESLEICRSQGDRRGTAVALGSLAWAAQLDHDFTRMRDLMEESLVVRMEIGDSGGIAWCLEKLAEASFMKAEPLSVPERRRALLQAVQIYGAAAALRAPNNSVIDPADQPKYQAVIEKLRIEIGSEDFESAWQEGWGLPHRDGIHLALSSIAASDSEDLGGRTHSGSSKPGGLSPRELETVVLIAHGKSNREIAERMTVRVKTVETYITRIMNKLGFDSRVQIATWALTQGFVEIDRTDSSN
jgi:predicted ATPase/DNA-binding CsgD family transcriptional regulator